MSNEVKDIKTRDLVEKYNFKFSKEFRTKLFNRPFCSNRYR